MALGCGPQGAQSPLGPPPTAEPPTPESTRTTGRSLLESDALDVLPRSTEAVLVIQGPGELSARLDWPSLRERHAALIAPLREESTATFGVDLLDAARWPDAGLDPQKPVGIALLDSRGPLICFFAGLRDRPRFERLLTRRAEQVELAMQNEPVGEAVLWTTPGDGSAAVVLRDGHAMLVVGPGAQGAARQIAVTTNAGSLAQDRVLRASAAMLSGGDLVAAFVLGSTIARALRGARAEEPRDRHAIVDALHGVALGISADSGPLELGGFISADPRSLPVAAAGLHAPALTGAPIELSASLRREHLVELFRSAVSWTGRPMRTRETLERLLGVDPARELLPAMTGSTRLMVHGRPTIAPASVVTPERQFVLTLAVELSDDETGPNLAPRLLRAGTSRAEVHSRGRWLDATWTNGEGAASRALPSATSSLSSGPAFLRAHAELALLAYLDMPLSYAAEASHLDPSRSDDPKMRRRRQDLAALEARLEGAWRRAERTDAEHVLASFGALGAVTFTLLPTKHGFRLQGELRPPSGDLPSTIDQLLRIREEQAQAIESQMQTVQKLEAQRIELRRQIESAP